MGAFILAIKNLVDTEPDDRWLGLKVRIFMKEYEAFVVSEAKKSS
jgi:hypothetical protein